MDRKYRTEVGSLERKYRTEQRAHRITQIRLNSQVRAYLVYNYYTDIYTYQLVCTTSMYNLAAARTHCHCTTLVLSDW